MLAASAALTSAQAQDDVTPSPAPATAAEPFPPLEETPIADGRATRNWLKQQGSRKQASTLRQTLSGPVMDKVHDRYIDSFNRAVPDRLRDDTPTSTGAK
jgi:hypothetical protein